MKGGRARDLVLFGQFKKNLGRIDLRCLVSHQAARGKKAARRRVHVVLRPQDRVPGLVADDEELVPGLARRRDKLGKAGVGRDQVHTRAIDIALQFREIVDAAGAVEVVADAVLVAADIRRNQAAFKCCGVEHAIVASDRVVEVDADAHGLSGSAQRHVDQRPADLARRQILQRLVGLFQ